MYTIELICIDECAPSDTYRTNRGYSVDFMPDGGGARYFVEYPDSRNRIEFKTGCTYRIEFGTLKEIETLFAEDKLTTFKMGRIKSAITLQDYLKELYEKYDKNKLCMYPTGDQYVRRRDKTRAEIHRIETKIETILKDYPQYPEK